ncbi:related to monooxigenase [Rhynchosporium graminicola]|uniref:Related to monooxigenase n=2 Tax=Rhynchosporium TaxID=38037 RepID=A0A1E1MRV2_RHYSE|nr:related to monooxigenase [Rhynchosporium commune]CZT51796.1 related to monooxigenase [Rhynchosporium secalis]
MGSVQPILELDALLVGAGFGSFTMLNKLRKQGLKVKIFEKGEASGGIWYWNCYPGARVDSDTPIYQLFDEELWKDFVFKERYAGGKELRRYFDHVEKVWEVRKDTEFNKHVDSAHFDESTNRWTVECSDGTEVSCRWFIPCIGFASKKYTPPVKNLGEFKGQVYHTAVWPQHDVSMKGKRVAVIGTGASGIQVAQEIGPKVKSLTCFIRTPNMCLPMRQHALDAEDEQSKKDNGYYEKMFESTRSTFSGFTYDFVKKDTFDDSPEERERFFEKLWEAGGFRYWLNTYQDMLFDQKANDEAYKFWQKKVRARISDPKKAEILAPPLEKAPHPWGTKRPSLEQKYYEVMDQENVKLVDVNKSPIIEVTETGLKHQDGFEEIDILVLATGFDSVTGSLAQLDIRGTTGGTIADHWKDGTKTSMGIAIPTFPNMFFLYGPQAPTAFSNGPSCTQFQAEFVEKAIKIATEKGITRLDSTPETEADWCKRMQEKWDVTLFPLAKSWYQGANIPGRKVEPLNWAGGMPEYRESLDKSLENNLQGWTYSTAKV